MSEKDRKIMEVFEKIIPKLSESDKEKLLAFGEGIALIAGSRRYAITEQAASDSAY